jgi:hypothetical protein
LGVIRFSGAPAVPEEVRRCLVEDVVPALARTPCIGAVWVVQNDPTLRARMDEVRVTGHQDGSADWAVFIEGGHDADLVNALACLSVVASWRSLGLHEIATTDRYRLLYTMTQSDRA